MQFPLPQWPENCSGPKAASPVVYLPRGRGRRICGVGWSCHQSESAITSCSGIAYSSAAAREKETSAKKCHWARQTWEKKIFSLICEEKHTESPSQSSCGLWVKSVLFGYRLGFSYGVHHLYLGTGWGENKKCPYSCSWLCLVDTQEHERGQKNLALG